jgi:hypothetical protein
VGHKILLLGWQFLLFGLILTRFHWRYNISINTLIRIAIKYILGSRIVVKDTILPWPCCHPTLQPAPAPVRFIRFTVNVQL